jgi:hypothetical protein
MHRIPVTFKNPYFWGTILLLSLSLLVLGWALSFPVLQTQEEMPVLDQVSPVFWLGLVGAFIALAGLSLLLKTSRQFLLLSILFVILYSAPQFLYLASGSDAGALARLVHYVQSLGGFDLQRDILVNSYFQWPVSIFFHRFLADTLNLDVYTVTRLGFMLACISVAGSLFLYFYEPMPSGKRTAPMPAFLAVALYLIGFYWVFNWQAAPYAMGLIFLIPVLALLVKRQAGYRLILMLFITAGLETHALVGVWLIMILVVLLVGEATLYRKIISYALLFLALVAQVTLIIYKNFMFLYYLLNNFLGYYSAFLDVEASDRALAMQTSNALNSAPIETLGRILKSLSFVDLALAVFALGLASILVLKRKKIIFRDITLFSVGLIYFLIGTRFAAIGIRSFQLLALAPASFLAFSLIERSSFRKPILIAGIAAMILFPSVLMRSHQSNPNYVKPSDIYFRDFLYPDQSILSEAIIFSDGIRPLDLRLFGSVRTPGSFWREKSCEGYWLLVDSPQIRKFFNQLDAATQQKLAQLHFSTLYQNGKVSLRLNDDCASFLAAMKP